MEKGPQTETNQMTQFSWVLVNQVYPNLCKELIEFSKSDRLSPFVTWQIAKNEAFPDSCVLLCYPVIRERNELYNYLLRHESSLLWGSRPVWLYKSSSRSKCKCVLSAVPEADIITKLPWGDEGAACIWPRSPPHHSFELFLCSPLPICSHPQDLKEQLPPRTGLWIFAEFPLPFPTPGN